MASKPKHPYHLVDPSPWPIVASFAMLLVTLGGAMAMHGYPKSMPHASLWILGFGTLTVFYIAYRWWRDVIKEGGVDKAHTKPVQHGLRFGMGLFIVSEIMFFAAFFWAFFHSALAPVIPLTDVWPAADAGIWPPAGIKPFDPWHLPFMNTLILLLSGTTVTWAHYALLENDRKGLEQGLLLTVVLGFSFTCLQALEYSHAGFGFKDGIYASTFYMATGFHGLHVLIGTIFLLVNYLRARRGQLSEEHHLGFEFAAWYWHFVDVVWLFLFVFIYVWGSGPNG